MAALPNAGDVRGGGSAYPAVEETYLGKNKWERWAGDDADDEEVLRALRLFEEQQSVKEKLEQDNGENLETTLDDFVCQGVKQSVKEKLKKDNGQQVMP